MRSPEIPTLDEIRAARSRIAGDIVRTPLIRWPGDDTPYPIHLKLENLQPIGSFKLRGAANAIRKIPTDELASGAWTASAGNMAQGVAWQSRRLGIRCRVVAPDHAPDTKLSAVRRLGAEVETLPFAEWWKVLESGSHEGMTGRFVHPVCDSDVIAGNATIGLEILEDLPEVSTVLVPYGGGGLSCGIAAAIRALAPQVKVYACEVATAAPLAAAWAAGRPEPVPYTRSFVDGIGSGGVLEPMWPLARRLLEGSRVVPIDQAARAVRLLVERVRIVAEGAGATPVAAALGAEGASPPDLGPGPVACVVSGGNIDSSVLAAILEGRLP
jgi:threonine dehydratase